MIRGGRLVRIAIANDHSVTYPSGDVHIHARVHQQATVYSVRKKRREMNRFDLHNAVIDRTVAITMRGLCQVDGEAAVE
jgi:hypothetical protein